MQQIKYNVNGLKDFDTEWLLHKGCSEWWYATSILKDNDNNLYSCQYTFLKMRLLPILKPYVLMCAITDFKNKKHYFNQYFSLYSKNTVIEKDKLIFKKSSVYKNEEGMQIKCVGENFDFDLKLDYGKGAFWHCDHGKLYMGILDNKQTTLYYSYTNMPTTGILHLNGTGLKVNGTTWFDKQGGTFNFMNIHTHWEWFSMRFYDNEEIMLFSFPKDKYMDGTYIKENKTTQRLNNYEITSLDFIEKNGYKFSCGWEVKIPNVKDEYYRIVPITDGEFNLAYFEELCYIYDKNNKEVGMCFVELLPGVYNDKIDGKLLLKKI